MQWWGNDPDGFVSGYEVSVNGSAWSFTTRQDSLFEFVIPAGQDTADIKISVRAVDNEGAVDPNPPVLFIPIANSPPSFNFTVSLARPSRNPVRSFPALRYNWESTDPDGPNDLAAFEFVWNDTTQAPVRLSRNFFTAVFVAVNPGADVSDCEIFAGNANVKQTFTIPGLRMNAVNVLYARALDQVNASSGYKPAGEIFIKKQVSDILLVNGQTSAFNRAQIQNFYTTRLGNVLGGRVFDTLQAGLIVNSNYEELSQDPFTQSKVFEFFKRIITYTDNAQLLLGLFQRSSSLFFEGEGRLCMIFESNDELPVQPDYVDFTPIFTFEPVSTTRSFLIRNGDSLFALQTGQPNLRSSALITGVRPFSIPPDNPSFRYAEFYKGKITVDNSGAISLWSGQSTLMSKRIRRSNNKADFIISATPMHRYDAAGNAVDWFRAALIDELEF